MNPRPPHILKECSAAALGGDFGARGNLHFYFAFFAFYWPLTTDHYPLF
jgi:hypothetical protein